MKSIIIILICLLSLSSQSSFGKEYQLGIMMGAPTGISGKVELNSKESIDAVIAYSIADNLGLEFHTDYLVERAHSFSTKSGSPLDLYYGIGIRFARITNGVHEHDEAFGPRAPLGLTYKLNNPRIEFFGEAALAFDITPATNLDLEMGLGVRYRF